MVVRFYIGAFQRVCIQKLGLSFDCFAISPKLGCCRRNCNLRVGDFDIGVGSKGSIDLAGRVLAEVEDDPVRIFRWLAPLNAKLWLFVNFNFLGTNFERKAEEADEKDETYFDHFILG
jgi:hypothetical protein